jgi:hypothetical protein
MESKVLLNRAVANDISSLRGKVISYLTLHVGAKSDITCCIVKFYNENAPDNDSAWLKLVKPGCNFSPILIPDHEACFFVMEYDHCMITDIYGTPIVPDGFTLHITEIAA